MMTPKEAINSSPATDSNLDANPGVFIDVFPGKICWRGSLRFVLPELQEPSPLYLRAGAGYDDIFLAAETTVVPATNH